MKLKTGDRVTFRDGRSGEVVKTYPWIDGRTIVAIRGQDPNKDRFFANDVVTVNGADPNASTKKAEKPSMKKWAEGAPTEAAHRYTTHGVLAGAYAGRGKGGGQIGRGGEQPRSHAFIDGAQTSACGISLDACDERDTGMVPSCGRCAARVRALAAKAKKG